MRMRARAAVLVVIAGSVVAAACGLDVIGGATSTSEAPDGGDSPIAQLGDAAALDDAGSGGDGAQMDAGGDGAPPCAGSPCILDMAASLSITCVAVLGERPRCWGFDDKGQLGSGLLDGGAQNLTSSSIPRRVAMVENAVRVAAGDTEDDYNSFACAIGSSGKLWCWGANDFGQLAQGDAGISYSPTTVPVEVASVPIVVDVAAGVAGAFVVDPAGVVHGWGYTGGDILGHSSASQWESFPSVALTHAPATAIAPGTYHACALTVDGTVDCWGHGYEYELGVSGDTDVTDASTVPALHDVVQIASGYEHTCALTKAGDLFCWGLGDQGQLGNDTLANATPALVQLPPGRRALQVSAGSKHTCAVLDDATVACWGQNDQLQLGTGKVQYSATPLVVPGVTGVKRVACGGRHTCALGLDGEMTCWGANYWGQLGRGDDAGTGPGAPAPVDFSAAP